MCILFCAKVDFQYWMCSRKNFKLWFCVGIALAVGVRIYIFHPMRMTDAILPGSPPRDNIKGHGNHFLPSLQLLAAVQASQHDRAHSPSLLPHLLAAGWTILFFSHHREFTKHYEESTPNLWTICVWEIILSSFIFPSKPTYPWRNKLDIFNSCS